VEDSGFGAIAAHHVRTVLTARCSLLCTPPAQVEPTATIVAFSAMTVLNALRRVLLMVFDLGQDWAVG
jgi:hypothetical protein|tara:strand:+ start:125 stop:328 length:204 start_codon:yes stop_codon:yes gene_type:complete